MKLRSQSDSGPSSCSTAANRASRYSTSSVLILGNLPVQVLQDVVDDPPRLFQLPVSSVDDLGQLNVPLAELLGLGLQLGDAVLLLEHPVPQVRIGLGLVMAQ